MTNPPVDTPPVKVSYLHLDYPGSLFFQSTFHQHPYGEAPTLEQMEGLLRYRHVNVYERSVFDGLSMRCVQSDEIDESPWYYPGGTLLTYDEVLKLAESDPTKWATLLANLTHNPVDYVVKTAYGQFIPAYGGPTQHVMVPRKVSEVPQATEPLVAHE